MIFALYLYNCVDFANDIKDPNNCGFLAEHIKYALWQIHQDIANILNEATETVTLPQELKHRFLIAIHKT